MGVMWEGHMSIYTYGALRSIKHALDTIDKLADNAIFSEMRDEMQFQIITAVHWIGDVGERIKHKLTSKDDDELIRAFYYLNNQLKHDHELEVIYYNVYESRYPSGYPHRYGSPPTIEWNNFKDNGRKESRGKRKHYDAVLNGREVQPSFIAVIELINRNLL